jgi:hypothetical protein
MAITSYPRTTVQGTSKNQNPQNGISLMLFNPSTNLYEAADTITFAGGSATSALQTDQINDFLNSTNGGILEDTPGTQNCTASFAPISTAVNCKYVTLINLSTNKPFTYRVTGGTEMTLENGYSVRINIAQSNRLEIRQTTGEGNRCEFIITQ